MTAKEMFDKATLNGTKPFGWDRILEAMEEYATQESEKARREEREKHSKLLTWAKEQVAGIEYPGITFEKALAAAGYKNNI